MKDFKYSLLIVLAAFIWGSAFVAQSVGMNYIGPFTFGMARFFIGGIVLIPVTLIFGKKKNGSEDENANRLLLGGIICGIVLCTASSFQQVGIQFTSPGKSGFITSLYVILVPIFGLFLRNKSTLVMWIGALISLAGMYLLCISETMSVNKGDVLTFFCAVFFAVHIIVVGRFAPFVDGVRLSCIQFFVAGIISTVLAFVFEKPDPAMMLEAAVPILYAGVLSCGVAFTLQTIAQRKVNPVLCSLLFSLESVFSVLTAWVIMHETLTIKEIIGCVLVFGAVVMVQIAPAFSKK